MEITQPLCLACRHSVDAGLALCGGCELRLTRSEPLSGVPPPGIDRVWSAAHHSGVPRQLVSALKHRSLLAAAGPIATMLAAGVPQSLLTDPLIPVPSARLRSRSRGFNPAAEIAKTLAARAQAGTIECLIRKGYGRQVGKSRGERRAGRLEVRCAGVAPPRCTLVDDVLTTGGTLTACAIALREAGAHAVAAVTFTRRP